MVVRTQVTLDAEARRRAQQRARELGISFAEYIRRLVDRDLGDRPNDATPSEIFALFDSGGADVAGDKDRLIDEAVRDRSR